MTTAQTKVWTRQQYGTAVAAGVFHGERVELINGEIITMAPVDARHATGVALANELLMSIVDRSKFSVRVQLPFGASECDEPEPDVAIVAGKTRDFIDSHPETAEVIFEIANSSLQYDTTTKREKYALCKVPTYIVVDLINSAVIQYGEPDGSAYHHEDRHEPGTRFKLLGHEVNVNDLLP